MATLTELEDTIRHVLNEGTAHGQISWAGTSKATLAAIQNVANLINLHVIPSLEALVAAQSGGAPVTPPAPEDPATNLPSPIAADEADTSAAAGPEQAEDAGVQQLDQAATDAERQAIEAGLLTETNNGPHGDEQDVSQEVGDDNG